MSIVSFHGSCTQLSVARIRYAVKQHMFLFVYYVKLQLEINIGKFHHNFHVRQVNSLTNKLKTTVIIGQKPERQDKVLTEEKLDEIGAMLGRNLLSSA